MKTNKLITFISSSLLVLSTVPLSSCGPFETKESFKEYKRSYKMNEVKVAEQNTFKKLNNITYPNGSDPTKSILLDSEKEAYNNFSNKTYHAIANSFTKDNMSYATIGLYSLMNEMYGAISRDDLKAQYDELLGLTEGNRYSFFRKLMRANSFANEDSTTQLKNAAFFTHEFNYSQSYLATLTDLYCEAYQLSFRNDAGKMVEWVNKAVNSDGFIDTQFLELTDDSVLYLFSTLYFKNMWASKYLAKDNVEDDFTLSNGSKIKATFMQHSYTTESYYDYGDYIAVTDYYAKGSASITYLVPKKVEDNIFELTKDVNIFENDKTKEVKDDSEYRSWFTVNLKTPKFTLKTDVDFKESFPSLGLGSIFDSDYDSFHNAFDDAGLNNYNIYVHVMKQRNEVEFNEDGTVVKSVTMAGMSKESAMPMDYNVIDVNLNQPFIYIIRDINDTPIFVGHVDNPKA